MAQWDPKLKKETWLFSRVKKQSGKVEYRRLKYNLVQYDNETETLIEPVSDTNSHDKDCPSRDDRPGIDQLEFVEGNPFEVHQFD